MAEVEFSDRQNNFAMSNPGLTKIILSSLKYSFAMAKIIKRRLKSNSVVAKIINLTLIPRHKSHHIQRD